MDLEPTFSRRPRVSSETRRLLVAAGLAVLALWVFARVRFPDTPASPNPVPPVLTQLTRTPAFAELASDVADLQRRIAPALVPGNPAVLRLSADTGVTWLPAGTFDAEQLHLDLVARDPGSALAVVRLERSESPATPAIWPAQRLDQPRYVFASGSGPGPLSVVPVFVGSLEESRHPAWSEPIWMTPLRSGLAAGSFVFTASGELMGLVATHEGDTAIVPGASLLTAVDRLLAHPPRAGGQLGVDVQPLSPALARGTRSSLGVIVTWIDSGGPAAQTLRVGDVIESIDDIPVQTRAYWDVRTARLAPGDVIRLRVRTRGEMRDTSVAAVAPAPGPARPPPPGLSLRRLTGVGALVLEVEAGSAAAAAGLAAGDVITLVDDSAAPTPAQIRRAFAAAGDRPAVVAFTRGLTHRVVAIER